MRHLPALALILALSSIAGPASGAPVPLPEVAVTTCGQIVPPKTLGYLTGDLDCTGYAGGDPDQYDLGVAVTLSFKSKLDLRGFTITGGEQGVLCDNLKSEKRRAVCEVFNGTITGAVERGVGGLKLYAHDLTTTNNAVGIYHYGNKGRIENVVVTGNTDDGIRIGKAKVRNATVTDNGGNGIVCFGCRANVVQLFDSTITGNGIGAFCTSTLGSCFDLNFDYSRAPRYENVVCGTSSGGGVCSLD